MPTALITGITGQDGSHLAELLLDKGYRVYGMVRRSSTENFSRIEHLRESLELVQGDLLDGVSITRLLEQIQPDEIYNLAAMSFVPTSWQQPVLTAEFTAVGVTRILEGMRQVCQKARFYQASSSEMFGKVQETPQSELTPFYPRSPYGVAKVYGHYITVNYRESYNLFACSGILFNHEGPRRGLEFVTRKISNTVARIKLGMSREQRRRRLSNLQAKGDCKVIQSDPTSICAGSTECTAYVAAGRGRGLCHRHRRNALRGGVCHHRLRPCRPGLAPLCRRRS